MWLAFKALPWAVKIGWAVGLLIALASLVGAVGYTQYQRGLNVSKVEIQRYKKKVSDLNAKLATANGKTSIKYVTQYVDRWHTITQTVTKNRDVIRESIVPRFTLTEGWIYAYNQSVQGLPIDPVKAKSVLESKFNDVNALSVANDNNGKCLDNSAKLDSLQAWVKEVNENGKSVTAK